MFEGILSLLETVYDQAEPGGSPFVIARRRGIFDQLTDGRNTNLGTLFKKYILRAGETPWPKPFHAMRASFETDLLNDGKVKPHTIARWLGHSIQIALKHYARIKDEDFDAVTGDAESCAIPSMTNDVSPSEMRQNPSKSSVQNRVQSAPEIGSNNLQRQSQVPKKAASCDLTQEAAERKMTPTGLQPKVITSCEYRGLGDLQKNDSAKSLALLDNPTLSPDDRQALETIFTLWPELPPETKIGVMKMIETATVSRVK